MQHLACPQCGQQLTIDEPMLPAACGSCGAALNATTHSFEPGSTAESPAGSVGVAFQSSSMTRPEELVARRAKFGPYRIVRYIAEGGFGRVFEAVDERTGRSVALKLPRIEKFPDRAKLAKFLEGFREEGRRAVELEHPAILKVLEVLDGDDVTLPAIVMEFVTGGTLLSRCRSDSRPTLDEAVEIMAEIAEAVHAAHLRGIVHRDLKPANILLTETGRPLVTDFGLALREEEQYARRGEHAGTLQYMSPEQINRRVDHLDGRSDIWSLSVMLYELLAGRRPFVARTNDELVEAIKNQPARPLRQRNASIDAELDELCLRGLRKAPEERPASAGEFAAALRRWLARHRESSSVKPAAQLIRRRLLVASLAAGSLAALVGCFLLAAGRNAGGEQKPRVLDGLAIEGQALPLL
ncbi:MAG TPA: serine/threonine-protein kinase, partial [Pirellulaceae bacterium]|nr:serine/threonine-protein kinase [Pirellulaceae bacterium]